jgi:hypothetical protein
MPKRIDGTAVTLPGAAAGIRGLDNVVNFAERRHVGSYQSDKLGATSQENAEDRILSSTFF